MKSKNKGVKTESLKTKTELGLEIICPYTGRLKVYGGWIVHNHNTYFDSNEYVITSSESMVFVPDPKHEWEIEE